MAEGAGITTATALEASIAGRGWAVAGHNLEVVPIAGLSRELGVKRCAVEAEADNSLIRTARRKSYPHIEPLETVEGRLPSPPFFRIHRSYILNLDRVHELRSRREGEWEVKMDPPVNKVLPVSRRRMDELRVLQ